MFSCHMNRICMTKESTNMFICSCFEHILIIKDLSILQCYFSHLLNINVVNKKVKI